MQPTANSRALQALDRKPYFQKLIDYGRIDGHSNLPKMRSSPPIFANDVRTDGLGNILDMPSLPGRPCFGIPSGYLRERAAPAVKVELMREQQPTSKCHRCKAQPACHAVVVERVKFVSEQVPELLQHLRDWRNAGGFVKEGFDVAFQKLGISGWRPIPHLLQRIEFLSSNDASVNAHWEQNNLLYAKKRKRAEGRLMLENWKDGNKLPRLINGLNKGREARVQILALVLAAANRPDYLDRISSSSIDRISAAWWGREYAKYTGAKSNPHSIARILIRAKLNDGKCESILRSSIKNDLARIKRMESGAKYNGGKPIWSEFVHPELEA